MSPDSCHVPFQLTTSDPDADIPAGSSRGGVE